MRLPILIVTIVTAYGACAVEPERNECIIVDMRSTLSDEQRDYLRAFNGLRDRPIDFEWMSTASVCNTGRYTIVAPSTGDSDYFMLQESGKPVYMIHDGQHLFLKNGQLLVSVDDDKRSVFFLENESHQTLSVDDRDLDGSYDSVKYDLRVAPDYERADVWDRNGDGCPDMRTVRQDDGETRRSIAYAGTWLDITRRNGKAGILLGGKFVELTSARGLVFEEALDECIRGQGTKTAN